MFLLIYYKWVGYGVGDASPNPTPNPHGSLKHPPPPPHYNNGSGKTHPIRGGAKRIPMGRMQIAIPKLKIGYKSVVAIKFMAVGIDFILRVMWYI